MSRPAPTRPAFRPVPTVRWAVQANGVRLVDLERRQTWFLAYPEAAVWDLLTRGRSLEQACHLVGLLDRPRPPPEPEALAQLAESWRRQGLLEWPDHG